MFKGLQLRGLCLSFLAAQFERLDRVRLVAHAIDRVESVVFVDELRGFVT